VIVPQEQAFDVVDLVTGLLLVEFRVAHDRHCYRLDWGNKTPPVPMAALSVNLGREASP
jgi:hypothetical protein